MSVSEIDAIGQELDKLFAFQDKHLSKEKRALLVDGLLQTHLPTPAIIMGLKKLMNDDLTSIKLGLLIATARSFVERSEPGKGCQDCANGIVVMRDQEGRCVSLACRCGYGFNVKNALGLKSWGGEPVQISNGRELRKVGGSLCA